MTPMPVAALSPYLYEYCSEPTNRSGGNVAYYNGMVVTRLMQHLQSGHLRLLRPRPPPGGKILSRSPPTCHRRVSKDLA